MKTLNGTHVINKIKLELNQKNKEDNNFNTNKIMRYKLLKDCWISNVCFDRELNP